MMNPNMNGQLMMASQGPMNMNGGQLMVATPSTTPGQLMNPIITSNDATITTSGSDNKSMTIVCPDLTNLPSDEAAAQGAYDQ